ncbi:ionotropic receptor 75a isoform X2 [Nilaparvata lugens]|uniref:ionotropic receptor 75a isoform X2 n=1 Tax=Nilaparvata lugens TaxID=108931 RepID=UPI00193CA310|nr:ionotropic receptor 75a isoform X2 [Nilaparvata lugens]
MGEGVRLAVLDLPLAEELQRPGWLEAVLRVHTYLAVAVDLDCPRAHALLSESSSLGLFNTSFYWLLLRDDASLHPEQVIDSNLSLSLGLETELTLAVNASSGRPRLYDVYQTAPPPWGRTFAPAMNLPGKPVNWNPRTWKLDGRTNLHGLVLNATIVIQKYGNNGWRPSESEIIEYLTNYEHNYYDTMTKFSYAVFLYATQLFNFRSRMFPTPSWGYKWNGTFDGMVSLLMNGTANVGITTAGIRTVRLPVIDFISSQTWLNAPKFILRHPRTARSTLNIFLHPLSPGVWFSIASIVVVTVAGTHFIGWVQVKLSQLNVTDNTWSSCLILVVGAICQQGSSEVPKQMAGRIFFLSLLVFTFVVYQFYTCSIVSTLLTEPPKTIHQLSDIMRTHMTIGVEDILTARDTLYRFQADPEIRKMYLTKIKPKKEDAFHTVEEGVALMKRGGFAFYVDPAAAYKLIEDTFSEQEKCDLTEVWMHEPDVHTLPIQKRSPYKKLFNFGMRLALEYGVVKRERRKWHSRRPECVLAKNHRSHVSIGLIEFRPALLLLAAGMMLALFVLVHEIMHHRGAMRHARQRPRYRGHDERVDKAGRGRFARGYIRSTRDDDAGGIVISGDYADERGRRGFEGERGAIDTEYRGARRADADVLEARLGLAKMRRRSLLPAVDPNP